MIPCAAPARILYYQLLRISYLSHAWCDLLKGHDFSQSRCKVYWWDSGNWNYQPDLSLAPALMECSHAISWNALTIDLVLPRRISCYIRQLYNLGPSKELVNPSVAALGSVIYTNVGVQVSRGSTHLVRTTCLRNAIDDVFIEEGLALVGGRLEGTHQTLYSLQYRSAVIDLITFWHDCDPVDPDMWRSTLQIVICDPWYVLVGWITLSVMNGRT